ncbi:MAG: hypothetical protein LW823_05440 [Rickettsiales bacterium]|jgi:hypothetical protein|nr:hypothetical protein [Rickettsiales bacterium]
MAQRSIGIRVMTFRLSAVVGLLCGIAANAFAQTNPVLTNATATGPASIPAPTVGAPAETVAPDGVEPATQQPNLRSLFFTPEQIKNINYAVNIYRKNARGGSSSDDFDEEDFLSRLTSIKQTPQTNRYYQYPQFFLESLVYHAADNWIVWVNGQKITQATPVENTDLVVESINQDYVSLLWRPASMDKVIETWDKSANPRVTVNKRAGKVQFSLRPNQTFSSYVMDILEGKVKPVTADTHAITIPEEQQPEAEGEAEQFPAADEADANNTNNQGLGGLIGAYQRLGDPSNNAVTEPTPQPTPPSPAAVAAPTSVPIPAP